MTAARAGAGPEETPPTGARNAARFGGADILAAAALLFLTFFIFREVLVDSREWIVSRVGSDLFNYYVPLRRFSFAQVRAGRLPLWNPAIFSGTPLLGDFQSALLYPPNWLHLVLPENLAINAGVALHVFLAGLFTYLWARGRGLSAGASYLAGLTFMLSGQYFFHTYAGQLSNLCAMPWAPLIFLALDRWSETSAPRWCLLGMPAVALQILSGHPQYVYYTALAAAAYAALLGLGRPRKARFALGFAATYLGGACLAAAQLGAGLAATVESSRGGDYWFASMFAWPPANFFTAVMPSLFGDDRTFPYYGRLYPWETSLFMGVTACASAAYAAVGAARPLRRKLVAMIALLSILALGSRTPLHRVLYSCLPGFGMFRGTSKFMFLATLFAAILAGTGFDRIREAPASSSRRLAITAAAAAISLLAAGAVVTSESSGMWAAFLRWLYPRFPSDDRISPRFVEMAAWHGAAQVLNMAWMLLAFAAAVAFTRFRRGWAYALLVLATLEMTAFARRVETAFSPDRLAAPAAWSGLLRRVTAEERVYTEWTRVQNRAMLLDFEDIWGNESFILQRYARFMAFTQGRRPDRANQYVFFHEFPKILEMLRCRYVLGRTAHEPFLTFEHPLPSALLVDRWEVKQNPADILPALFAPDFDPRRTVLLESRPFRESGTPPPAASGTGADPEPPPEDATVSVRRLSTDRLELAADARRPSILLVTDSYSSGWRASPYADSSQRRYSVLPADYVLRAIPLAAGRHHLLLEYDPPLWRAGALLSIVSLLAFMAAWNLPALRP